MGLLSTGPRRSCYSDTGMLAMPLSKVTEIQRKYPRCLARVSRKFASRKKKGRKEVASFLARCFYDGSAKFGYRSRNSSSFARRAKDFGKGGPRKVGWEMGGRVKRKEKIKKNK